MKYLYFDLSILLLATLIFLIPGCSSTTASVNKTAPASSMTVSSAPDESTTQTIKPIPTAKPTAKPDAQPAPASTPIASAAASDEKGKEVIADGFYYIELNDEIKARITGISFPADITDSKVTYDDLRYIKLKYYDFDGNVHEDGELIVDAKLAGEVTQIFYELFKAKYPFTSVRLVDDYGEPGDDNLSMAANNTSAFNYRYVTGTDKLSLHSFGDAIDINPKLNPYIDGSRVSPANGAEYADRSLDLTGMIDYEDLCYQLFTDRGWKWGGDWDGDKDYQHFSKKISS